MMVRHRPVTLLYIRTLRRRPVTLFCSRGDDRARWPCRYWGFVAINTVLHSYMWREFHSKEFFCGLLTIKPRRIYYVIVSFIIPLFKSVAQRPSRANPRYDCLAAARTGCLAAARPFSSRQCLSRRRAPRLSRRCAPIFK